MTDEELAGAIARLKELDSAATQGDWSAVQVDGHDGHRSYTTTRVYRGDDRHFDIELVRARQDAELLVALRNTALSIIKELETRATTKERAIAAYDAVAEPATGHSIETIKTAEAWEASKRRRFIAELEKKA